MHGRPPTVTLEAEVKPAPEMVTDAPPPKPPSAGAIAVTVRGKAAALAWLSAPPAAVVELSSQVEGLEQLVQSPTVRHAEEARPVAAVTTSTA